MNYIELMARIAESLQAIHPNSELIEFKIEWNTLKEEYVGYIDIGNIGNDISIAEFEILQDGRFYRL